MQIDERDESRAPLSAWWEWLPTAAVFAYLPIGLATKALTLQYGARAYAPGAAAKIFFLAFVHCLITCPVLGFQLASALSSQTKLRAKQILAAMALLAAPLFSLAYYLGEFRDAWQKMDAVITVIPAVAISVLQYRRLRSTTGFVFVLAVTSFIPLFLVGDVLGAWPTFVSYETHGPGIYTARAMCAAFGIWLAFDAIVREEHSRSTDSRVLALFGAVALAAFTGGTRFGWAGPLLWASLTLLAGILLTTRGLSSSWRAR